MTSNLRVHLVLWRKQMCDLKRISISNWINTTQCVLVIDRGLQFRHVGHWLSCVKLSKLVICHERLIQELLGDWSPSREGLTLVHLLHETRVGPFEVILYHAVSLCVPASVCCCLRLLLSCLIDSLSVYNLLMHVVKVSESMNHLIVEVYGVLEVLLLGRQSFTNRYGLHVFAAWGVVILDTFHWVFGLAVWSLKTSR